MRIRLTGFIFSYAYLLGPWVLRKLNNFQQILDLKKSLDEAHQDLKLCLKKQKITISDI